MRDLALWFMALPLLSKCALIIVLLAIAFLLIQMWAEVNFAPPKAKAPMHIEAESPIGLSFVATLLNGLVIGAMGLAILALIFGGTWVLSVVFMRLHLGSWALPLAFVLALFLVLGNIVYWIEIRPALENERRQLEPAHRIRRYVDESWKLTMTPILTELLELRSRPILKAHLEVVNTMGCALDYLPFEMENVPDKAAHQRYAIEGMRLIDEAFRVYGKRRTLSETPPQWACWLAINGEPTGELIDSSEYMKAAKSPILWHEADRAIALHAEDYQTAFFFPPHGLSGDTTVQMKRFEQLNLQLWGDDLQACTIYSWSTNWSNYFDAGHEWWGAFYWTVYSPQTKLLIVIGASATD